MNKNTNEFLAEYLFRELADLYGAPDSEKDGDWAYTVCKASRAAHMRVLLEKPDRDVINLVIEHLGLLRGELIILVQKYPEAKVYEENVDARIDSLKRFRDGECPYVGEKAPDDEKEIVKMVGECRSHARAKR